MMTGERTDINLYSPCHTPEYPESWSGNDRFGLRFKAVILQASIKDKSRLHLDLLIHLKLIESLKADSSFSSKVKIASLNLAGPELPDLNTVADISFVLGYSEPAAFIHSFKKWHGIPPQKFRESFTY